MLSTLLVRARLIDTIPDVHVRIVRDPLWQPELRQEHDPLEFLEPAYKKSQCIFWAAWERKAPRVRKRRSESGAHAPGILKGESGTRGGELGTCEGQVGNRRGTRTVVSVVLVELVVAVRIGFLIGCLISWARPSSPSLPPYMVQGWFPPVQASLH